jgi:DNA-binding response OmpR family regulator
MTLTVVRAAEAGSLAHSQDSAPPAARVVGRLMLFIGPSVRPDEDVTQLLARAGARPVCIGGVTQALRASSQVAFDGAVVDSALLQPTEEAWVARLRQVLACPLLVVSDRADEVDEIVALEQGADDYVVRPVSKRLLSARLIALMRQSAKPASAANYGSAPVMPQISGWQFDAVMRRLRKDGRSIDLTEYLGNLLGRLVDDQGRVVTREQLLHGLRGLGSQTNLDGIDTYVHRLRKCLEANGVVDFDIECVRGRGYLARAIVRQ